MYNGINHLKKEVDPLLVNLSGGEGVKTPLLQPPATPVAAYQTKNCTFSLLGLLYLLNLIKQIIVSKMRKLFDYEMQ